MSEKKLHMIGNAHIDPVWLWQWPEGLQEVKATFRSALDRLNEDPDFIFTASSAAYYAWIEQNDPGMFEEIQERVAEGRWQIVGGWWVEPDCNIPSGESFARHALYSQRYFREKFGVIATVGYCVDSFGHHGMLPQILKKSGMNAYVFMRPSPHEKELASRLFWWESDDGSRVLTFRLPFEYLTWSKGLEAHVRRCAAELKPPFQEMMCFYGVGNHGGGPTQENLSGIRRLQRDPELPQLVFSSPNQFFQSVCAQERDIPTVHDDLQHHASGCYSTHSAIKRLNRQAENRLLAAEKFSTLAQICLGSACSLDGDSSREQLAKAWKNVLFNQFHDILAGTSIEAAYEDARNSYGEALAIADRVLNDAVQSLSWRIRIEPEEGMKPIAVFNPHAWPVRTDVELECGRLLEGSVLLDDADRSIPLQIVQSHSAAPGRSRISFLAELPPLGYRTFRLTMRPDAFEFPMVKASNVAMENDRLRLEIDPNTGLIQRLYDKVHRHDVFLGDAARPVVIDDPSDTWGHNVFKFDCVVGEFRLKSIKRVEHGPVKSTLRITSVYGASQLVQDLTMYPGSDKIDVKVTLDWHERFKMLKLRFPVNLEETTTTYEIPYGHIEREANGEEEPMQSWIDVSGVSKDTGEIYGLCILNDGKYSADVKGRDIGLTVARSPIYAHHTPVVPDPDRTYSFIDQGVQQFAYTLLPHAGSWESANTVRHAAELNQRPVALIETYHPKGSLPQCNSFLSVDAPNVVVSAVKTAEDNDDLILRIYETDQRSTQACISIPALSRTIPIDLSPCEIKTLRVPKDRSQPVCEINLLEF